jgi:hypothetical protein
MEDSMSDKQEEIKRLKNEAVKATELGKDVAPIYKRIAELRDEIAIEVEQAETQRIVDARKVLRDKAEQIKAKIQNQGEAIDTFLKARDSITEALLPILDKAKELPGLQDKCFAEFHDAMQAGSITRMAGGFLPADLTIPMLQLGKGDQDVYDVSKRILMYLSFAYGLLANLQKVESKPMQPPIDPELDFSDETTETNCIVCAHESVKAINKDLKGNRSLRDMEAQFKVSRSSLSRHRTRCLKLGPIRVEPASSTSSANQTYFGK